MRVKTTNMRFPNASWYVIQSRVKAIFRPLRAWLAVGVVLAPDAACPCCPVLVIFRVEINSMKAICMSTLATRELWVHFYNNVEFPLIDMSWMLNSRIVFSATPTS